MSVQSKPRMERAEDDSRHGVLIRSLRKSAMLLKNSNPAESEDILTAIHWLKEWVEPWSCPDCGFTTKVPGSDIDPRHCDRCGGNRMFPYSYLEQERMNKQMTLMLSCLTHYARKRHGHMAQETLRKLADVQLTGTTPRGAAMQGAVHAQTAPRSWWKFWARS